jgi:hypothetical protein
VRVLFATTRGADVLFAAPASTAALAARAGLRFRPVAEAPASTVDAAFAPVWRRESSVEHVVRDLFVGLYARTAMADMLTAVDDWRPDLIVRETMEFASAVAAVRYDVPQARIGIHLDSRIDSGGLLEGLAGDALGIDPEALMEGPLLTRSPGDEPDVHRFRTDVRPRSDPDLVYVTFGSETPASLHFPDVYRSAAEALDGLPVLMTIGDRRDPAELGPLPASVRVTNWVKQADVMPRALAMVSHGGSGTTLMALAAGVPQAFVPLFVDGPANAARVAELGAGIVAGDLRAAVVALLEGDEYATAAGGIAEEIAALPPIEEAATLLQRSAAGHAIR